MLCDKLSTLRSPDTAPWLPSSTYSHALSLNWTKRRGSRDHKGAGAFLRVWFARLRSSRRLRGMSDLRKSFAFVKSVPLCCMELHRAGVGAGRRAASGDQLVILQLWLAEVVRWASWRCASSESGSVAHDGGCDSPGMTGYPDCASAYAGARRRPLQPLHASHRPPPKCLLGWASPSRAEERHRRYKITSGKRCRGGR